MGYITKGSCEESSTSKMKVVTCLIFGILFLSVAVFTIVVDPVLMIVRHNCRVDYGTPLHEVLSSEADAVHLSVYLFNITNAERFQSGEDEKLKMDEVGPFTYQEMRSNEDLEIDKEASVIRYTPRHRSIFLPEESVGNPKEIIVNMPNVAMMTMASAVASYGYLAKIGFNMLTTQLRSNVTVSMSVHDYLWGYDDPLIKLGNGILPGWISFDKLGLLDRLYDKNATKRVEVSSKEEDKFMIKKVNGLGGLDVWGYGDPDKRSRCNSFTDSFEGLGYPPELRPDRPLRIYRNVLCRLLELEYTGNRRMDFGIEGYHYKISNKTYTKIPENECLCNKGICYEGISDLSPCFYGLPLVLSNAHFLNSNPAIYEKIEGMKPNEEKHGSGFTVDPIMGMVMSTKFSVQVNLLMKQVDFNSKTTKFSNMFLPVMYLKIVQPPMPEDRISVLRMVHIYLPYMLLTVQLVLVITGLILLSHAAKLTYCKWYHPRRKVILLCQQTKDNMSEITKEPLMER